MTFIGAQLVWEERERQIIDENYSLEADAGRQEELVEAAVSYLAYNSGLYYGVQLTADETPWPWSPASFKPSPTDNTRNLQKAGALIAAAIDAIKNENKQ